MIVTLKDIEKLSKPYPYEQVAEELNNLDVLDSKVIDNIIGKAEVESFSMVRISKLKKLLKKEVKDYITKMYSH